MEGFHLNVLVENLEKKLRNKRELRNDYIV